VSEQVLRFPDGFLWGAVASAHQVEGNITNNDWCEWERGTGRTADGSVSGEACLHYERFEEDFALVKSLGMNAHRFSIEWSRVEPEEGVWADEAVAHYLRVLNSLKDHGIAPFVTLNHYTIPLWLAKRGGWESGTAVEAFERYARRAVRSFGAYVQHWVTINAPVLYAYRGYVAKIAPPGMKSRRRALRVCRNLVKAHVKAYHAIHNEAEEMGSDARVGLAKYVKVFDPSREDSVSDRLAAVTVDYFFNELVPNCLHAGIMAFPLGFNRYVPEMEGCFDFIGLNYYAREIVRFRSRRPRMSSGERVTERGDAVSQCAGEVYPEGLYRVLEWAAGFGKPIYITENGLATDNDDARYRFLLCHLKHVYDAIQLAGDIRGYFHNSLMDGFEWHKGYGAQTGLIDVSRDNLERQVRPSGRLYGRICRENGLPADLVRQHCPDAWP
jgi:beta-glucosidase